MTLLVVLGAGASFDSVAVREPTSASHLRRGLTADAAIPVMTDDAHQSRPPLASQLFDPRPRFLAAMRQFAMLDEIIPQLQLRPDGLTVESLLEQFSAQASAYPRRLQQLAALRFYISEVIALCERNWLHLSPIQLNLSALLDEIELIRGDRMPCAFVTFNYDRLLEYALERRYQRRFSAFAHYVVPGESPVYKLHGSIDWLRRLDPPAPAAPSEYQNPAVIAEHIASFGPPGRFVTQREHAKSPGNGVHVPAIAVPLLNKQDFECPPEHVEHLRLYLPYVRSLLCIGWRAGEAAFLELLHQYGTRIEYVTTISGSEEDAGATTASLQRALPNAHYTRFAPGFTAAIGQRSLTQAIQPAWPLHRENDWPGTHPLPPALRRKRP